MLVQRDQTDQRHPHHGWQPRAERTALPQQHERADRYPEQQRRVHVGPDVARHPRHTSAGRFENADALAAVTRVDRVHQNDRGDHDGDQRQQVGKRVVPDVVFRRVQDQRGRDQRRHRVQQQELQVQVGLLTRDLHAVAKVPPARHPGVMDARQRAHLSRDLSGCALRVTRWAFITSAPTRNAERATRNPKISATVAPALLMSEPAPFPEDPFSLLEHGTIEGIELIPWGSNYTFAALLRAADGATCFGVYKPRRGEVPLRDFPSGTLYKREVAAYRLSQSLGWDMVPPTIVGEEGRPGIGSLQLYV